MVMRKVQNIFINSNYNRSSNMGSINNFKINGDLKSGAITTTVEISVRNFRVELLYLVSIQFRFSCNTYSVLNFSKSYIIGDKNFTK